jgi:hypothetical protein
VSAASGGSVIGDLGNSSANTLTVGGVTVSSGGSYRLTIYYIAGNGPRSATLTINGGSGQTLNFGGTATWSTVGSMTVTVNLNAGANSLRFSNSTAWAPDIDKLVVR